MNGVRRKTAEQVSQAWVSIVRFDGEFTDEKLFGNIPMPLSGSNLRENLDLSFGEGLLAVALGQVLDAASSHGCFGVRTSGLPIRSANPPPCAFQPEHSRCLEG